MQHFLLENALNYVIEQGGINLEALNGKTLHFSLDDLHLSVNFVCVNDRIFVTDAKNDAYEVDIRLKSSAFLALLRGEALADLLRQDKIIIYGDVKTAQLLVDLLQQSDVDLEELLSHWTGDIIAHQAGKFARGTQKSDYSLTSLKDKLTNLLITPKRFT